MKIVYQFNKKKIGYFLYLCLYADTIAYFKIEIILIILLMNNNLLTK